MNDAAGSRGFALLIVLWSVVLLTLLASGISAAGRTEARLAANLRGAAEAEAEADGAVFAAVFHLLDPAAPWVADGAVHVLRRGDARIAVQVDNEAGKVNPNLAAPELLQALLRQVGAETPLAIQLAGAIADWRGPGDGARAGGGKTAQYRAAGLAYAPPGAPFESLDELGAVLGMPPALLARLSPLLSVLTEADPDPAAAAPAVLRALGVDQPAGPARPLRLVAVRAEAETGGGSRFVRRAAIRLGAGPKEPLFSVLAWDAVRPPG